MSESPRADRGGLVIGPMREEDLDEVLSIETASYPSPWSRQSFLFDLKDNPFARAIVARRGDAGLVGYGCSWQLFEELRINNLAVHPAARQGGVGRALLRRMLEDGRSSGCKVAILEVRPSNLPARRLYESEGFEQVGRRKGYYREHPEDALILALELPGLES